MEHKGRKIDIGQRMLDMKIQGWDVDFDTLPMASVNAQTKGIW